MHTMSDKITEFTYAARQKYGTDSYAAGYLSALVDEMIRELRIRGSQEMNEMANYYERAITQAIITTLTGK